MRQIVRIARTELDTLFLSPIAWLLLIALACQVGINFMEPLSYFVGQKLHGQAIGNSITAGTLTGFTGLYETIQSTLYLYIPLVTMGLLSREFSSGSIKLLYSSPVTSLQIVMGKYAAMVAYALCFALILAMPLVVLYATVNGVETGLALSGLLGLFLLICAYMAVGLFMSSLTSYQVVAAIATLFVLALLGYIGGVGQDIDFVRELTHWLSMDGRAGNMVSGLICSDDVCYFFLVIALFLALTLFRLDDPRTRRSMVVRVARYVGVAAMVMALGYATSRPQAMGFVDTTSNKRMTLSTESQQVMKRLDGPLTITAFANVLDKDFDLVAPDNLSRYGDVFDKYTRFKPETRLRYIYYYAPTADTTIYARYPGVSLPDIARKMALVKGLNPARLHTPDQVAIMADLAPEEFRLVRLLERGSGERAFLRVFNDRQRNPGEPEITTAIKLIADGAVEVSFLSGHGERDIHRLGDRDYTGWTAMQGNRGALVNRGFDVGQVELSGAVDGSSTDSTSAVDSAGGSFVVDIPESTDILVIADPQQPLNDTQLAALDRFIACGGNMLLLTDAGRGEAANPLLARFGLALGGVAGTVADDSTSGGADATDVAAQQTMIAARATPAAAQFDATHLAFWSSMPKWDATVLMNGAGILEPTEDGAVAENGASDVMGNSVGTVATGGFTLTPLLTADSLGRQPVAFAAVRTVEGKQQRIAIFADADCLSNSLLALAGQQQGVRVANFDLIPELFSWLSDGKYPVWPTYPETKGHGISLGGGGLTAVRVIYVFLIPALLALSYGLLWFRRRRG